MNGHARVPNARHRRDTSVLDQVSAMSAPGTSVDPGRDDEDDVRKGEAANALSTGSPVIGGDDDEKRRGKYLGRGTREDPFVVVWGEDDPENPFNWPKSRKWLVTIQVRFALPYPAQ